MPQPLPPSIPTPRPTYTRARAHATQGEGTGKANAPGRRSCAEHALLPRFYSVYVRFVLASDSLAFMCSRGERHSCWQLLAGIWGRSSYCVAFMRTRPPPRGGAASARNSRSGIYPTQTYTLYARYAAVSLLHILTRSVHSHIEAAGAQQCWTIVQVIAHSHIKR